MLFLSSNIKYKSLSKLVIDKQFYEISNKYAYLMTSEIIYFVIISSIILHFSIQAIYAFPYDNFYKGISTRIHEVNCRVNSKLHDCVFTNNNKKVEK